MSVIIYIKQGICRALDVSLTAVTDPLILASQQSVKEAADQQLNERTKAVLTVLEKEFESKVSVSFQEITSGVSRRTAASCFMEILQLKTRGMIDAKQSKPFQDITLLSVAAQSSQDVNSMYIGDGWKFCFV